MFDNDRKESQRLYSEQYRIKNREKINTKKREYRLLHKGERKEESRRQWLKRCYSMTQEDYDIKFRNQNGCCAICKNIETTIHGFTKNNQSLAVDHCHKSGKIRGLLCRNCNTAIGLLNEDISLLEKAKEYLGKYK